MSASPRSIGTLQAAMAQGEVLYESATTRVTRIVSGQTRVIRKEHLGANASRRLRHEKEMLGRLAGIEGVVQLAGEVRRKSVLALQDAAAAPLMDRVLRGPMDTAAVLDVGTQLARTLAAVHRAGVVHRDVNPANVLLSKSGRTVLIDFDLAAGAEDLRSAGKDAPIAGTLGYLAPEQTGRTGRGVDQRADLYALGVTLYQMCTGRLPFESVDMLQLVRDHLVREPAAPSAVEPRVPQGLSRIVLRLLAKAPEHRYESLEARVQARTRELQQTQEQLVATARRAGKSEIANNVLHNIGNVLNSVNVSAGAVRRTLDNSRADGLARAVELMNAHAHDLGGFVHADPRGKMLLPYLNELVEALREERAAALADLDRVVRSVDHISHVVATQQSIAGPSSVLESARPQEVMEEALRISAQLIEANAVTVVRRYEDLPASALDKPRLLQILVNLIRNAAQAMDAVPQARRQLTLATELTAAGGAEHLRISVRDAGEGIAPGHLPLIFSHGFTTRKGGHGFGLHSSALAAMEMGGRLTAHSDGPGQGAVFMLELPMRQRG